MNSRSKPQLIADAREQVEGISAKYNMGLITNNERYNQVIDVWTSANAQLTELAMKNIRRPTRFQLGVYDA
jgi:DNA-directed RNA polymerase subunit beta'